jgi:hypothetical protein
MARKPTTEQHPQPATETDDLRERIERLEERLDNSILGDDGVTQLDKGIDKAASGDPLQRAVRRSNDRRGSRKA